MENTARAGRLNLVGGHPALDFANTVSWRSTAGELDHLRTAGDLLDWMAHAGLITSAYREDLRAALAQEPVAARRLHRDAVALRDAIHQVGSAIAGGEIAAEAPLAVILRVAGRAIAGARLSVTDSGAYEPTFASPSSPRAILGQLAWSMLDLLRSERLAELKRCPAHDCGWLFQDTTRNRSRRWCDMASCGNRAKVKRFRRAG